MNDGELDPGKPLGKQTEARIGEWRSYLLRHRAIHAGDGDELEDHLRGHIHALVESGLAADEAFLVAALRIGRLDALTREFAREHSDRLWKQLVGIPDPAGSRKSARTEAIVAVALAGLAALLMKVPELFGRHWGGSEEDQIFYVRNLSLFAFPCLAAFFAWKRRLDPVRCAWIGGAFVLAAAWINLVPFALGGMTLILAVIHLPIALWLAIGVTYAGGHWGDRARRMNFVRFSGELFLYFVLIALGGGVLTGLTMGMFAAIGVDAEWLAVQWILPCGALGAVLIAAWLVEAKQSVIENMAPVLTRLFTPLFTAVLLVFLGTMAWTGTGIDVEREVLIGFDLLLVVVVGLLLYAISARDPQARPGVFDWLLLVLVVSALLVDAFALGAVAGRISEFGFSANKTAALGENLILLGNLAGSAWLLWRFLRGRGAHAALERWQMAYLPVHAVWAALVVVVFPPLFDYM